MFWVSEYFGNLRYIQIFRKQVLLKISVDLTVGQQLPYIALHWLVTCQLVDGIVEFCITDIETQICEHPN